MASGTFHYQNSNIEFQDLSRFGFTRISTLYNILLNTAQSPKLKNLTESDDETQ